MTALFKNHLFLIVQKIRVWLSLWVRQIDTVNYNWKYKDKDHTLVWSNTDSNSDSDKYYVSFRPTCSWKNLGVWMFYAGNFSNKGLNEVKLRLINMKLGISRFFQLHISQVKWCRIGRKKQYRKLYSVNSLIEILTECLNSRKRNLLSCIGWNSRNIFLNFEFSNSMADRNYPNCT